MSSFIILRNYAHNLIHRNKINYIFSFTPANTTCHLEANDVVDSGDVTHKKAVL